jgi:hypothetical protein
MDCRATRLSQNANFALNLISEEKDLSRRNPIPLKRDFGNEPGDGDTHLPISPLKLPNSPLSQSAKAINPTNAPLVPHQKKTEVAWHGAHVRNPSFSEDGNQEDQGLREARINMSLRPHLNQRAGSGAVCT